jgi:LysM repeat protein
MSDRSDPISLTQKISLKGQSYTAQRGDTLASVAERFNLTPKFLARMNRMRGDTLPSTSIEAGTVLTIPRVEFDPFGPIGGAWAEGIGWTQSGWSESPWYESGPMWTEKGKFVEVGDEDPLNLPNLPGGGIVKP